MNISKFLLIEAALVIGAIPLILLLQVKNKKSALFPILKEERQGKTLNKLPNKEKLLDLEKLARIQGTGIELNSLLGNWKFVSVWKDDIDDKDSVFSSLIRVFSANLEMRKDISKENSHKFSIIVSIQFGLFSIEFSGSAYLKGKQPVLFFFFNLIEVKLDSSVLLRRSIKEPIEKEKSFFALIASKKNFGWLAARGQGGGLILWVKD